MIITTKVLNPNGDESVDLSKIMRLIPANIDVYVFSKNNEIWLQTSEVNEEVYKALNLLLGDMIYIPAPTLKFTYGTCNSPSGLNIRSSADINSEILGVLETGQRCKFDTSFINDEWFKIVAPVTGYVYKEFITLSTTPTAVSDKLVNFTASWEGFSSQPYQDIAGNWTVGYGDCTYNVKPQPVTRQEAWNNLKNTLNSFANDVARLCESLNLTQNQFDSIVDFCYNEGFEAFKSSDLYQALLSCANDGIVQGDFIAWDCYTNSNGQLEVALGLERRRKAETQMFIYNQYNNN